MIEQPADIFDWFLFTQNQWHRNCDINVYIGTPHSALKMETMTAKYLPKHFIVFSRRNSAMNSKLSCLFCLRLLSFLPQIARKPISLRSTKKNVFFRRRIFIGHNSRLTFSVHLAEIGENSSETYGREKRLTNGSTNNSAVKFSKRTARLTLRLHLWCGHEKQLHPFLFHLRWMFCGRLFIFAVALYGIRRWFRLCVKVSLKRYLSGEKGTRSRKKRSNIQTRVWSKNHCHATVCVCDARKTHEARQQNLETLIWFSFGCAALFSFVFVAAHLVRSILHNLRKRLKPILRLVRGRTVYLQCRKSHELHKTDSLEFNVKQAHGEIRARARPTNQLTVIK